MPIVQAGRQFDEEELKRTAGMLATNLRNALNQADDFRMQLASWPDADLITLGLDQPQINALKGFYVGDLPPIYTAFVNSAWVKQLLGLGI